MNGYTKEGDLGSTNVFGGKMVSKSNLRIKLLGAIEELNASIGMVVAKLDYGVVKEQVIRIQHELISIYLELQNYSDYKNKSNYSITEKEILDLEKEIDDLSEKKVKLPKNEILIPGGSEEGAILYLSYAICRRVEREIVQLTQVEKLNPFILPYFNRLSHWLEEFAQEINRMKNIRELKHKIKK